jgi:hypothetical protein
MGVHADALDAVLRTAARVEHVLSRGKLDSAKRPVGESPIPPAVPAAC